MKVVVVTLTVVLAISLSGFGINLAFGHHVTLVVDDKATSLMVLPGPVSRVLFDQQIILNERDWISTELTEPVIDDMTIVVRLARPIDLTFNGDTAVYWTYATQVSGVVSDLGLTDGDSIKLSHPLDTPIPRGGMELTIKTGFDIQVTSDGKTTNLHSYGTVYDALVDLDLTWSEADIITPAPRTSLSADLKITLVRVTTEVITREADIPYPTEDSPNTESFQGTVTVVIAGVNGSKTQVVEQILHDGKVVEEKVLSETVLREPVTRVTTTGTLPLPSEINITPGSAQAIAYEMVRARGWDDTQFQCLVELWNRESGWRVNASNSYSGAYGIPQALPGSKMASAGADWQTNPATQITWGLGYISGRYGTPCGAWSFFLSNNWY
ncbi:MAG: G5 domain-containing protein [Propionibacteriaceae bacterium]|jgi:uncharacterized protein YabE (DUF348 family)|nr:G5 domain-containing protein [Propionibacteriaceae bacterium]